MSSRVDVFTTENELIVWIYLLSDDVTLCIVFTQTGNETVNQLLATVVGRRPTILQLVCPDQRNLQFVSEMQQILALYADHCFE